MTRLVSNGRCVLRGTLAVIICVLCFSSASAQTAADLEAKFGKPAEVYSVSENIWMTPEFAADGRCAECVSSRSGRTVA